VQAGVLLGEGLLLAAVAVRIDALADGQAAGSVVGGAAHAGVLHRPAGGTTAGSQASSGPGSRITPRLASVTAPLRAGLLLGLACIEEAAIGKPLGADRGGHGQWG
jgi:hypothetical protein